ncbi:unnamed protein product [Symbiodinium natans]|uniref:Uncharacterized protein n=1 Tax=Symbiodinium natans TaxID=878477 RepID=A0A812M1R4_9DINO|nr:unnamed protein product [Symbiodinium natans]
MAAEALLRVFVLGSGFWFFTAIWSPPLPPPLPAACTRTSGPPLRVTLSHCVEEPFLYEAVCKAGFSPHFTWDTDFRSCGAATDLAIVCGTNEVQPRLRDCAPKGLYEGSRKVTYNPRFDILAAKSGLCQAQNNASRALGVDFAFAPPCFTADGPTGILEADVHRRALLAAGNSSMWVAKKDSMGNGHGIYFLTAEELKGIEQLKVPVMQRAVTKVPTYQDRKLEIRSFLAVTSMDPPRIYVCNKGLYKTAGQPLVPEAAVRAMPMENRSSILVANVHTEDESKYFGQVDELKEEFQRQGLDVETVEKQIAEKITRAFLSVANQTTCEGSTQSCEGHVAFGITDSLVDMENKEPYLLELMLAQQDWVFRGSWYSYPVHRPHADAVARRSLTPLTSVALASLQPDVPSVDQSRYPPGMLSPAATQLLEDPRTHAPVQAMIKEAHASASNQCTCLICQQPKLFMKFFPRGHASSSFAHPWSAYYEIFRAEQTSSFQIAERTLPKEA